ncbi:MAG: DUF308 domain-containing protein [Bacteroidales bacterium]|nr:DUF308 domain-containing protein [Bacteroidales bacterium]
MFKNAKITHIVLGILFCTLGLLCFCSPLGTIETFARIAGIVIVISGVVFFCLQYKAAMRSLDTLQLSVSVLVVALGVLIVFKPSVVATLLGIVILFEGIDFALTSIKYRRAGSKGWWLMLLMGLLAIVLGGWSIFSPQLVETTLSILFGIGFIGIGIASFVALAGINLVEDYIDSVHKALIEKDNDYVEAEVVK